MEISSHEQNGVIVYRISGEVRTEDIIESWNRLFSDYPNLKDYLGITTVFLDARLTEVDNNLNNLVEYFTGNLYRLRDLKIAVVMDTPMVTSTIILGQRLKQLQIKPFTTEKGALEWIHV
jgi:hypothetical protein